MSNRTKIILIVVLAIVLVGLLVRSILMLKAVAPSKPSASKEIAKAPTSTAPTVRPPLPTTSQPPKITGLSLALPARNPFKPIISKEEKTTPSRPAPSKPSPPHLPAPVISQVQPEQAPLTPANLTLTGTVIGTQRVAILKIGEKSIIVRQGDKVDGLTLKKVDRGKVLFEGLEGEITLKGGELK